MPVTGDFRFVEKLAKKIAALPQLQAEIARVAGAACLKQLNDEFNQSRNPYGEAWKPLRHPSKRRGGSSAKPLVDRGTLKNSYSAQPTPSGFEISTRTDYAAAHQYGAKISPHSRTGGGERFQDLSTGRFLSASKAKRRKAVGIASWKRQTYANGITIPRRQMVPEQDTGGIGEKWGAAINKAAAQVVKTHFQLEAGNVQG